MLLPIQNWMRDYDPTTGRYLQADPLGLVDGASVYGYALQNPGRYVDPSGLRCYSYKRNDGTIGIRCQGTSTYCPTGDCGVYPSHANDPEYAKCMTECGALPHGDIIEACATFGGFAPGRSGLPIAGACVPIATRLECTKRCDRMTGYCKSSNTDDSWASYPFSVPRREKVPIVPGYYR